jgi:demethylmenaquinone methyltransferase / 2-methoxy-6-polyprenyl-1,4-benzoquinol methylase
MPLDRPPHAPLQSYYGQQPRQTFLRQLFDATAADYDALETLLSFGTGRAWRREVLRRNAPGAGADVLDLATGTGVLAAAAAAAVGPAGSVVALDLSGEMLRRAARRPGVIPVQASVDALPFRPERFDLVTMGYALRHVADLQAAFAEWARVLRPGGSLILLEIGRPRSRAGLALARAYLGRLIPALSHLLRGREAATLMHYYWDTIEACVAPEVILGALGESGFTEVRHETMMGVLHTYTGRKPLAAQAAGLHAEH